MTGSADDLADWLRLACVPGLGGQGQRALLSAFGLPGHIFAVGRGALAAVVGGTTADALLSPPPHEKIERTLAWAGEAGNHILTLADADYPRRLFDIPDPPPLLYVKGEPALLSRPGIALVGARSATAAGEANAEVTWYCVSTCDWSMKRSSGYRKCAFNPSGTCEGSLTSRG